MRLRQPLGGRATSMQRQVNQLRKFARLQIIYFDVFHSDGDL